MFGFQWLWRSWNQWAWDSHHQQSANFQAWDHGRWCSCRADARKWEQFERHRAYIEAEIRRVEGLKAGDAAEVAQEFASCNELHDEIEISGILGEAFELDLHGKRTTMKGWCSMLRIWLSFCTWSICFDFKISIFFNILAAKYFPVCLCFTSRTRPKVPESQKWYPPRWSRRSRNRWS